MTFCLICHIVISSFHRIKVDANKNLREYRSNHHYHSYVSYLFQRSSKKSKHQGWNIFHITSPLLFRGGVSKQDILIFNATKIGDGSESDPDGIPTRFLTMQKNDRVAAKKSFKATLAWREKHDVDTILSRPHPKFDQCKAVISHYFSGRDKEGNPIFIQQFGRINFEYAKQAKITSHDLLMHYVYILEYCWNILEPQTTPREGLMTSILDLDGVGWSTFQDREFMTFAKEMVSMISSNYPTRSYKTLIINVPGWFGLLYQLFKPILRKSTREKIEIYSKGPAQTKKLKELLGESIPDEIINNKNENAMDMIDWSNPVVNMLHKPGPFSTIEHDMRNIVSTKRQIYFF